MGNQPEENTNGRSRQVQFIVGFIIFVVILFALKGCRDAFIPAFTYTPSSTPTNTPKPADTSTNTPTNTPTPSETLTLTGTLVPTFTPTNTFTETPTLQAPSTIVSSVEIIDVETLSTSLVCNSGGGVNYAIIKLRPYNGTPPYIYEILLSSTVSETHDPVAENEPIVLRIIGGQTKSIRIKSSISTRWEWTGKISIPAKDEQCVKAAHTKIAALSSTPVPTFTTSIETPTSTSIIPTKTYTPSLIPPTKTFTPSPVPPTKTYTPSLIPASAKQCEDGIDNDDDKLIDYPNDPDCTDPMDNKEKP